MLTKTSSEAHDLRLFFLIAFAWCWLLHLSRLLDTAGWLDLPHGVSPMLGNLAVIGPAVAAFVLTGLRAGKTGMRELWRRGDVTHRAMAELATAAVYDRDCHLERRIAPPARLISPA